MNAFPPHSSAEEQAALWAAKIDGASMTAADRQELETWLAARPEHRALLSSYCQFSADLEQHLPVLVIAGAVPMPPEPVRAPRVGKARVVWIATTLAAAAAIAVMVWPFHPRAQTDTVATSVAQRKTLQLADGSVVELNARTSLLVEVTSRERHVRMAEGEAFFTVAKDKSRPFIVETPAGSVRVTGTVFDVHAESSDASLAVTVVEGSVRVTPGENVAGSSSPVALGANDQLVVANGVVSPVRQLSASALEDALAWRRGEIVFEGTPLGTALARFARYHGITINTAAPIATLTVGGRYNLDNLESFLNDIQAFLPVTVSRESSGAYSVKPRS
jgi:transmembrane sensor